MARNLCAARGWQLDEDASVANQDLDVSGFSVKWRERPGLMQHYRDAQAGRFDRLIIYAVDRLGRNTSDTLNAWDEFEKAGATVYAVRESVDSSTATGTLLRNILASVAEMESLNASARIKANVEARAKAGRLHGGRLPSWLERGEDGSIIVNGAVSAAVKKAVALRLSGHSYTAITRTLNKEGFRTKSGGKFEKSYIVKLFTRDWVESMFGVGYTRRRGRTEKNPRTGRRQSRGTPIAIEGAYPQIIDEATYRNLLHIATAQDGELRETRDRVSERWMLNGAFYCAVCGSRMSVHSRNRPDGTIRRTYFCEAQNNDPGAVEHPVSRVDADMVELAVLLPMAAVLPVVARSAKAAERLAPKHRKPQEVRREIDRLVGLYTKGTIEESILDSRVQELNEELAAISRADLPEPNSFEAPEFASRVVVRRWLQDQRVKVEYPVYVEGHTYEKNWRTGVAAPVPYVRLFWEDGYSLLSPVYRNGVRGQRCIFEVTPVPPEGSFHGFWKPDSGQLPPWAECLEVSVTDDLAKLARS